MSKLRWALLLALFGLAGLLPACSAEGQTPEALDNRLAQQPALAFLERKSGRIVYVGADGNIYVTDQAGTNRAALTSDAQVTDSFYHVYRAPTWSPDGSQVALIEESGTFGSQAPDISNLYTVPREGGILNEAISSQQGTLYYLYWSPDGERVGYLVSNAVTGNSELGIVSPDGINHSADLGSGSPLYVSWAPDGDSVLLHSDAERTSGELSALDISTAVARADGPRPLPYQPAAFQAPAWSPDGTMTLFAIQDEGGTDRLVVADTVGEAPRVLASFSGKIAFGWSPNGRYVAYVASPASIAGDGPSAGILGDLHIFDMQQDREVEVDEEDAVLAFFWSPNSKRLLYFVLRVLNDEETGEQAIALDMRIARTASGETYQLLRFQPTEGFLNTLQFFDQYQQSATLWSPDNQYVTFSLATESGPLITIMHASGAVDPRGLGEGIVSFWSWE